MKLIELLLTETIDNLGIVGDVVKVRPGYARNFLLPRNLATTPTAGNIKRLAERRKIVEAELKLRRAAMEAIFEKLQNLEITMQRSANEQGVLFGGVSQHDIAQAIRNEGYAIEDRMVRIGAQIKRLDTYHIPVVMASDLKTEIKLWVVSDKPLTAEEKAEKAAEEAAAKAAAEAPAEAQAPAAEGEEAPAEGKKKGRKSRKQDKQEEPAAKKF